MTQTHEERALARTTDRYVAYYAEADEAFDPSIFTGIFTAVQQLLALCRPDGVPERPPLEVALAMKNPEDSDLDTVWAAAWQKTKQQVTKKTTGLKRRALDRERMKYATRTYRTFVDEAKASTVEELTEMVIEARANA